jgi:carbonic anhydrase
MGRMKIRYALLLVFGTCLASEHAHWSYNGATGPSQWSKLEADFGTCASGKSQSPIDIRHEAVHDARLPAIQFAYQAAPLKIVDNGHTIQVDYPPGSFITIGGERYELVQFHFHHPSEEKIDGQGFDMVAHLVHKNAAGRLAVVAVLFTPGTGNPLLDTLWSNAPRQQNHEFAPGAVRINAADLLPADRSYYAFTGSLTTPPCTEGVRWFVLRHPGSLSPQQLGVFATRYPMDARPVQPLNGRDISASR